MGCADLPLFVEPLVAEPAEILPPSNLVTTCQSLVEAARLLPSQAPSVSVTTDSGVWNVNGTLAEPLGDGPLLRVLTQIDIAAPLERATEEPNRGRVAGSTCLGA